MAGECMSDDRERGALLDEGTLGSGTVRVLGGVCARHVQGVLSEDRRDDQGGRFWDVGFSRAVFLMVGCA